MKRAGRGQQDVQTDAEGCGRRATIKSLTFVSVSVSLTVECASWLRISRSFIINLCYAAVICTVWQLLLLSRLPLPRPLALPPAALCLMPQLPAWFDDNRTGSSQLGNCNGFHFVWCFWWHVADIFILATNHSTIKWRWLKIYQH